MVVEVKPGVERAERLEAEARVDDATEEGALEVVATRGDSKPIILGGRPGVAGVADGEGAIFCFFLGDPPSVIMDTDGDEDDELDDPSKTYDESMSKSDEGELEESKASNKHSPANAFDDRDPAEDGDSRDSMSEFDGSGRCGMMGELGASFEGFEGSDAEKNESKSSDETASDMVDKAEFGVPCLLNISGVTQPASGTLNDVDTTSGELEALDGVDDDRTIGDSGRLRKTR